MPSRDAIIRSFILPGNEDRLLQQIAEGDRVAVFQLLLLNMPAVALHVLNTRLKHAPTHVLMRSAIRFYIDSMEAVIGRNSAPDSDWHLHFFGGLRRHLTREALKQTKERKPYTELSAHQVGFLSALNKMLREKEVQITAKAKEYLTLLRNKLADKAAETTDYEFEAAVQFITFNTDGDPVYTSHWSFCIEDLENDTWHLVNDPETDDWREQYMPVLTDPYCYLMHDLYDHSGIGHEIYNIETIWTDYRMTDQNMMKFKNGRWAFVNSAAPR